MIQLAWIGSCSHLDMVEVWEAFDSKQGLNTGESFDQQDISSKVSSAPACFQHGTFSSTNSGRKPQKKSGYEACPA